MELFNDWSELDRNRVDQWDLSRCGDPGCGLCPPTHNFLVTLHFAVCHKNIISLHYPRNV